MVLKISTKKIIHLMQKNVYKNRKKENGYKMI